MDVLFIGPVCNDFDSGKSITRAIGRALNIETFLGPEMASSRKQGRINNTSINSYYTLAAYLRDFIGAAVLCSIGINLSDALHQ